LILVLYVPVLAFFTSVKFKAFLKF